MIGRPNIAHGLKPGNSRIYDSEAQAYFNQVAARGGSISDVWKDRVESFIIYLRDLCPAGNQWQYLQRFKCFRNSSEIAALTDIKAPSSPIAIAVNSPTFTTNGTGYQFNGTSQYIRSGFIPSVHGGSLFTAGNCSFGTNYRSGTLKPDPTTLAGCNDGTNSCFMLTSNASGLLYWVNAATGSAYSRAAGTFGCYMIGKSGATTKFLVPNGPSSDGGMPTTALPTNEMFIAAHNDNGSAVYFQDGYKDFWFAGSYSLDFAELDYAINTYLMI